MIEGRLTWLITGASSGLGHAFAEVVLEASHNVVVTARRLADVAGFSDRFPGSALSLELDVTNSAQARAVTEAAEERFGGIDVLVNNAGYGYRAAIEEGDVQDVQRLFDTNFFGPVGMIKLVLPAMRRRRSGVIINISSIGARQCAPGSGYYVASKAALEAMTESLRQELAPLGVAAFAVEPGGLRTEFAGRSLTESTRTISDYAATAGKRRKSTDTVHGTQPGDPRRAAKAIFEAVTSGRAPSLLLVGSDAVEEFRKINQRLMEEVEEWSVLSSAVDFEPR